MGFSWGHDNEVSWEGPDFQRNPFGKEHLQSTTPLSLRVKNRGSPEIFHQLCDGPKVAVAWPPSSQDWGIKCWICWWVAWMISAVCQAMGAESWGETSRFSLWWSSIAMEPTDDLPMRHGDFPELCERMWVWMVNPMKYSLLNHGQTTIKSPFWTFRKTCKTCRSCCARQHFQGAETRDFAMFITDTEVAVGAGELMLGLWRGLIL